MNVNEGNMSGLFNGSLYALENWSARSTKSYDSMTSATTMIIIYFGEFTKC